MQPLAGLFQTLRQCKLPRLVYTKTGEVRGEGETPLMKGIGNSKHAQANRFSQILYLSLHTASKSNEPQ